MQALNSRTYQNIIHIIRIILITCNLSLIFQKSTNTNQAFLHANLALCHCEPPSFGTNSKVWKRNCLCNHSQSKKKHKKYQQVSIHIYTYIYISICWFCRFIIWSLFVSFCAFSTSIFSLPGHSIVILDALNFAAVLPPSLPFLFHFFVVLSFILC